MKSKSGKSSVYLDAAALKSRDDKLSVRNNFYLNLSMPLPLVSISSNVKEIFEIIFFSIKLHVQFFFDTICC